MKMCKEVVEVSGEGFESLIGQTVTLFCSAYIYTGVLIGVNSTCVKLKEASIVYETGALNTKTWQNAQKLPNDWYVQLTSVESFGILK